MDLFARLLVRAALWIRRPPSKRYVYALLGVAVLVAVVAGLEAAGLWPEWATSERLPRRILR